MLDLRYEARDIDQHLTAEEKIDAWFDAKTEGLSNIAKTQIKQRWDDAERSLWPLTFAKDRQ